MSVRNLIRLLIAAASVLVLLAAVRSWPVSPAPVPSAEPGAEEGTAISSPLPAVDDSQPLVEGFRAFVAQDPSRAVELLSRPSSANGRLEDWRLLVYSLATAAQEDLTSAQDALRELVTAHPSSPIRGLAILEATRMAAQHRSWESALAWAALGREQPLRPSTGSAIDIVIWEMGSELERLDLQTEAGRRLLVEDPALADELGVFATLRRALGLLDATELLTNAELEQRATRLIEGSRSREALETLDLVADDERDFDWALLRAEALTKDRRGREALEVLADLDSSDLDRRLAVVYQRALAAREAARVRRGRTNLPSDRREAMRKESRQLLRYVADRTTSQELRVRCLRILFDEITDLDDSFEQALPVLQELKRIEPDDTTGTRYLFGLGWQAYERRDYPVAIGYWSELESLYSGTNTARGGRYWTGRAHEAMGHSDRASGIYREIVSLGVDDFYSRHAKSRLGGTGSESLAPPSHPTEPWPSDPLLERARWLSDLGLSELALHELDAFSERADPRAFSAEKAVILARLGQRRDSIGWLVRAFPSLGRASQGIVPQEALELYYPLDFRDIIEERAREQRLSPFLVFAMVRQESAFDAAARSWAGARGLMQLMPSTGREIAQRMGLSYSTARLEDPDFSVRLGTRYFRQVLEMFDGNLELALAGYNGGPYRIKKLWRRAGTDPELDRFLEGLTLEETKTYVKRILLFEDTYQRLYTAGG